MTQYPPEQSAAVQGASGPRANFGQRLVAYLIDVVLYVVVLLVLVAIAGAISESLAVIVYILGIIGSIAYFIYFEGSPSGQTIGKKVMKIRVIDFGTGGPIGFGRALLRWVGKIVSGLPCYLGYLWMLWDREKQTWHDKIATSVVVPESAYPVQKWPG